jgi:hypothetical protein
MAEASCGRERGNLWGKRLIPEQIKRMRHIRPQAEQPVILGYAVRKIEALAKPE